MPFERSKNSVSLICHSLPHKVNNECSYQNPILFGLRNKRMNVTLSNTKVCLDGLLSRASRLNESTESFGKQTQANMTLYNTTRCLCVRQRFSSVGQTPVHLRLIESRASVSLCNNTTDHAFERFMPVPVSSLSLS